MFNNVFFFPPCSVLSIQCYVICTKHDVTIYTHNSSRRESAPAHFTYFILYMKDVFWCSFIYVQNKSPSYYCVQGGRKAIIHTWVLIYHETRVNNVYMYIISIPHCILRGRWGVLLLFCTCVVCTCARGGCCCRSLLLNHY